jgi:hypothetical protein
MPSTMVVDRDVIRQNAERACSLVRLSRPRL